MLKFNISNINQSYDLTFVNAHKNIKARKIQKVLCNVAKKLHSFVLHRYFRKKHSKVQQGSELSFLHLYYQLIDNFHVF